MIDFHEIPCDESHYPAHINGPTTVTFVVHLENLANSLDAANMSEVCLSTPTSIGLWDYACTRSAAEISSFYTDIAL